MIIDAISTYIRGCPCLKKFNGAINVNVNYLGDDSTTYSIEEVPVKPIIKKYVDGSTMRQFQFIFASREPYGSDVLQNIENSGFYEEFSSWIENNNSQGIFPNFDEGKIVDNIEVLSPGYAFMVDENVVRYQIELRLIYFQRRN